MSEPHEKNPTALAAGPAKKKSPKWQFWGWYAVKLLLITLIGVELIARALQLGGTSPLREKFDARRRDLRPYVMFGTPPYNGPKPTASKPIGELRIFMLGGSTVEHGEPAIAGHLQSVLHSQGLKNAKVFNFGVVSSVSGMELIRIVNDLVELEPDIVIMYNGANDMLQPLYGDPRPGYPIDYVLYEKNPLVSSQEDYPIIPLIAYSSYILRKWFPDYFVEAFTDATALKKKQRVGSTDHQKSMTKQYLRNILKAKRVCDGFNTKFMAFFQPTVYTKAQCTPAETDMLKAKHAATIYQNARTQVRTQFHEWIKDETVEPWAVADFSDVFDDVDETVYWNSVHINEPFRIIVATRMAKHVLDAIKAQ